MTPERKSDILFWGQVGLYVAGMVFLLGLLFLFWYAITTQLRTMEEDRARDKAMLQQHNEAMQDHATARQEHTRVFDAMLTRHEAVMERLSQPR
jgi:arginine exporter protein ArgO